MGSDALAIHEQGEDVLAIGRSQRWLSRLSWLFGRRRTPNVMRPPPWPPWNRCGPGRELAMAYSNLAQLRMLGDDAAEAVRWGTKAIELARGLGDRDAETHALNNVGAALSMCRRRGRGPGEADAEPRPRTRR